ncbi:hypothetical protein HYFRA_00002576 [Hymenoscyphus fraxineus]|uniref:Uncharacterized protein n=1 Tax=Hymenoscyphus fraxineus TaxID=746836 RepID=A0A9N9L9L2_9HELO|nr:hypothetical protein HYFRA_00002576 [Hymenoscyphus fraxineus]
MCITTASIHGPLVVGRDCSTLSFCASKAAVILALKCIHPVFVRIPSLPWDEGAYTPPALVSKFPILFPSHRLTLPHTFATFAKHPIPSFIIHSFDFVKMPPPVSRAGAPQTPSPRGRGNYSFERPGTPRPNLPSSISPTAAYTNNLGVYNSNPAGEYRSLSLGNGNPRSIDLVPSQSFGSSPPTLNPSGSGERNIALYNETPTRKHCCQFSIARRGATRDQLQSEQSEDPDHDVDMDFGADADDERSLSGLDEAQFDDSEFHTLSAGSDSMYIEDQSDSDGTLSAWDEGEHDEQEDDETDVVSCDTDSDSEGTMLALEEERSDNMDYDEQEDDETDVVPWETDTDNEGTMPALEEERSDDMDYDGSVEDSYIPAQHSSDVSEDAATLQAHLDEAHQSNLNYPPYSQHPGFAASVRDPSIPSFHSVVQGIQNNAAFDHFGPVHQQTIYGPPPAGINAAYPQTPYPPPFMQMNHPQQFDVDMPPMDPNYFSTAGQWGRGPGQSPLPSFQEQFGPLIERGVVRRGVLPSFEASFGELVRRDEEVTREERRGQWAQRRRRGEWRRRREEVRRGSLPSFERGFGELVRRDEERERQLAQSRRREEWRRGREEEVMREEHQR